MHIQLCIQESSTSFWKLICNSKNKGSSWYMEQALTCILGLGHYNFLTFGCLTFSKSCDVPWFIIIRSVNLLLVCTIFISCLQSSTYPSELQCALVLELLTTNFKKFKCSKSCSS
jgi:hypothetical protein